MAPMWIVLMWKEIALFRSHVITPLCSINSKCSFVCALRTDERKMPFPFDISHSIHIGLTMCFTCYKSAMPCIMLIIPTRSTLIYNPSLYFTMNRSRFLRSNHQRPSFIIIKLLNCHLCVQSIAIITRLLSSRRPNIVQYASLCLPLPSLSAEMQNWWIITFCDFTYSHFASGSVTHIITTFSYLLSLSAEEMI